MTLTQPRKLTSLAYSKTNLLNMCVGMHDFRSLNAFNVRQYVDRVDISTVNALREYLNNVVSLNEIEIERH